MVNTIIFWFSRLIFLCTCLVAYIIRGIYKNIIIYESILTSIVVAIVLTKKFGVHSAISLCIGIVIFIALILIQSTLIGFTIITLCFSVFWALIFALVAFIFSNEDLIWAIVGGGLGFISMIILHIKVVN